METLSHSVLIVSVQVLFKLFVHLLNFQSILVIKEFDMLLHALIPLFLPDGVKFA